MYTITDEELDTTGQLDHAPRYTIKDNNGNTLYDNVKIDLKTPVSVQGTSINKATLEGIQTDLMNETKELVAEYELTENASMIDIQGLDLVADGGIYDIVIVGDARTSTQGNSRISIQFNEDTGTNYYEGTSNSDRIKIKIEDGSAMITLIKNSTAPANASLFYFSSNISTSSIHIYEGACMYKNGTNITSMQLIPSDGVGSSYYIDSGTKVQIYKRR